MKTAIYNYIHIQLFNIACFSAPLLITLSLIYYIDQFKIYIYYSFQFTISFVFYLFKDFFLISRSTPKI